MRDKNVYVLNKFSFGPSQENEGLKKTLLGIEGCCLTKNRVFPIHAEPLHAEEISANNRANDHKSKLEKIMKTKTVTENIKKVLEFDKECEHNGQKLSTRYCTLITLHNLCQFAGKKPFKLFTRADLINFLDMAKHRKFQDTRYRARTKNVERVLVDSSMNHVKYQIKRLFQWMNGMRDKEYPETVSWNDNGFVLTTHVHKSKSKRTGRIPLCMR